tara:strand:- start:3985 stop:5058 length:1074 start_codon:yes stop_codon:yes gene_type:complete
MKRSVISILVILLLLNLALAQDCTTELPKIIDSDLVLCEQEYNIDYTAEVKSNVNIDCKEASLIGNGENTAFLLKETENSEIINCNLVNFESGFYLDNSNNNIITNNKILDSKQNSIYIMNSNDNQIYDNEINTDLSYDESSENIFCKDLKQNRYLNVIGPGCEKAVKINNAITGTELQLILSKISETRGLDKSELITDFTSTLGKIDIEKTFQEKKVTIKINANKESDFTVYEYIPKETLNSTDLITTDAVILDKDPLMMWEFTNTKSIEVQYELPMVVKAPKTIVIETISVKAEEVVDDIEEEVELKVVAHDDGLPEIIEPDAQVEDESNLNAILTFIILLIIIVVVVYLIKKKW